MSIDYDKSGICDKCKINGFCRHSTKIKLVAKSEALNEKRNNEDMICSNCKNYFNSNGSSYD